jgi:hypothetical protein
MMVQMWQGASVSIALPVHSGCPRQHGQVAGLLEISLSAIEQCNEMR